MQNLKWIAAVRAVVGLLFLFFGLIRQGVVQLVVAVAFLAIAVGVCKPTSSSWQLVQPSGE